MFNYLFGSLARVFTTLSEVDDVIILYGFIAGFALNIVLAGQMVYYWNAGTKLGAATEQKPVAAAPVSQAKSAGRRK